MEWPLVDLAFIRIRPDQTGAVPFLRGTGLIRLLDWM